MIYYSLLFSSCSLIFLIRIIIRGLKNTMSLSFIFSTLSLFLVVFPLFIDSFIFFLGYGREWVLFLNISMPSFPYMINAYNLFNITLFVMLFNFIVLWRSEKIIWSNKFLSSNFLITIKGKNDIFLILLLLGYLGFLLYVYIYGFSLSNAGFGNVTTVKGSKTIFTSILVVIIQTLLPLTAIPLFNYILKKKYLLAIIAILPVVLIAFYTNERTHIIPHLFFLLYAYIIGSEINFFRIVKIIVFSISIFYLLRFIRIGFENPLEFIINNIYPVYRDDSNSNLYFCFDRINYLYTGFKGISQFFFIDSNSSFDVTRSLADYRVNWENGTLHPTLYGWAFMDMKWYGLLIAFIFRTVFYVFNSIFVNSTIKLLLFPIFILFIVVSLRGSVQFAWSHFIYSTLLLIIVMLFLKKK